LFSAHINWPIYLPLGLLDLLYTHRPGLRFLLSRGIFTPLYKRFWSRGSKDIWRFGPSPYGRDSASPLFVPPNQISDYSVFPACGPDLLLEAFRMFRSLPQLPKCIQLCAITHSPPHPLRKYATCSLRLGRFFISPRWCPLAPLTLSSHVFSLSDTCLRP